jgi:putative acetyltransferase
MIRLANLADAQAIWQIRRSAIEHLAASHYSPSEVQEWRDGRSVDSYHAPIEQQCLWVYQQENSLAGFAQLNLMATVVEAVYVAPAFARQGIGLQLLRNIEQEARQHGIAELSLEASLNAVDFYRAAGYLALPSSGLVKGGAAIIAMCQRL